MDSKHTEPLDISIVVACRNEERHIAAFLDSLVQQDMRGLRWEALIADGQSTDRTREMIQHYSELYPEVRWIDNPGKIVSTGLNRAIQMARGTLIARMDAHTEYASDYCLRCVEVSRETGAANVGGAARTRAKGFVGNAIAAAYHSRFSTGGAAFHQPDFRGYCDTVPYGCWQKSTLEKLGLFDELLVRNQDDELNLRLLREGGTIWQDPSIVSWYSPRSSFSTLFRQYFQYGFWKVAVIRKHRLPGSWRHLVPGLFVLSLAGLPLLALATFIANAAPADIAALLIWSILLISYGCALAGASVLAARQHGWKLLPILPLAFLTYHVSYGLGFLLGCARFTGKPEALSGRESFYSQLTR